MSAAAPKPILLDVDVEAQACNQWCWLTAAAAISNCAKGGNAFNQWELAKKLLPELAKKKQDYKEKSAAELQALVDETVVAAKKIADLKKRAKAIVDKKLNIPGRPEEALGPKGTKCLASSLTKGVEALSDDELYATIKESLAKKMPVVAGFVYSDTMMPALIAQFKANFPEWAEELGTDAEITKQVKKQGHAFVIIGCTDAAKSISYVNPDKVEKKYDPEPIGTFRLLQKKGVLTQLHFVKK